MMDDAARLRVRERYIRSGRTTAARAGSCGANTQSRQRPRRSLRRSAGWRILLALVRPLPLQAHPEVVTSTASPTVLPRSVELNNNSSVQVRKGGVCLFWKRLAPPLQKAKPRIPSDTRIYAIGDVHGRADLLRQMFSAIDNSLMTHPVENALQVLLGDYIDRGPNSREVIDTLLARARRHQLVCLKGNHESYAVQFLSDPSVLSEWRRVGGVNTLLSYGVRPATRDDPRTQREIAEAFRAAMPESHHRFLRNLALSFTCGDFFFTHAGVRPGISLARQWEQDLLWIRNDFLGHREDFGKIIVHGHTPAKKADIRSNRINIDTGAYVTGRLTCLILQGDYMAVI
jgi:serine/threonine protein phosphatase 1